MVKAQDQHKPFDHRSDCLSLQRRPDQAAETRATGRPSLTASHRNARHQAQRRRMIAEISPSNRFIVAFRKSPTYTGGLRTHFLRSKVSVINGPPPPERTTSSTMTLISKHNRADEACSLCVNCYSGAGGRRPVFDFHGPAVTTLASHQVVNAPPGQTSLSVSAVPF